MEKHFSIQEVYAEAVTTFRTRIGFFIAVSTLLLLISSGVPNIVSWMFDNIFTFIPDYLQTVTSLIINIIVIFYSLVLQLGFLRILFNAVDGKTSVISDLFSASGMYRQFLNLSVILGCLTLLGYIAFIIPGIILSIVFMFSQYFLVDERTTYTDAMAKSRTLTHGLRLKLFVFEVVTMGINMIGILCLGIGYLVTTPITSLARVYLYRTLRKQII